MIFCVYKRNPTVVVTPEMEEAGFRVFSESGIGDGCLEADKLVLAEIYRAMFAVGCHQKMVADDAAQQETSQRQSERGLPNHLRSATWRCSVLAASAIYLDAPESGRRKWI